MTPDELEDIAMRDNRAIDLNRAELDRRKLIDYVGDLFTHIEQQDTTIAALRAGQGTPTGDTR